LGTWPKTAEIEKKKEKRSQFPKNKFEILSSRVMRCRVVIRKQKVVKEEEEQKVQCFRYWEEEHYK